MNPAVQRVGYFPHCFNCSCGNIILVQRRERVVVVRCASCQQEHGPFDLYEPKGIKSVTPASGAQVPQAESLPASQHSAEFQESASRILHNPNGDDDAIPYVDPPGIRKLKRLIGYVCVAVGSILMGVGGLVVFGSVRGEFSVWGCIIGSVMGAVGGLLRGVGKSLTMISAVEKLQNDSRPAVVLLRSFGDDQAYSEFESLQSRGASKVSLTPYTSEEFYTFEECVAECYDAVGPVVAIGRPGEQLPTLGAARLWVSHAEWKNRVQEQLATCGLVVMFLNTIHGEKGLWWELKTVLEQVPPEKIIFLLPPVEAEEAEARWNSFHQNSDGVIPRYQPGFVGVGFDKDRNCKLLHRNSGYEVIQSEAFQRNLLSIVQAESVHTLIVKFDPLRGTDALTRGSFIVVGFGIPILAVVASIVSSANSERPFWQIMITIGATLLGAGIWIGLFGILRYLKREKILQISPSGLQYSVYWGSHNYSWHDIHAYNNQTLQLQPGAATEPNMRLPSWYFRMCPEQMITQLILHHLQSVSDRVDS